MSNEQNEKSFPMQVIEEMRVHRNALTEIIRKYKLNNPKKNFCIVWSNEDDELIMGIDHDLFMCS